MNQVKTATNNKMKSESRLISKLTPWVNDLVANYRIGDTRSVATSRDILKNALLSNYIQVSKDVLGFDVREYKQEEDDDALRNLVYGIIASNLYSKYITRSDFTSDKAITTADSFIYKVSLQAVESKWTIKEAKSVLNNYLKNHKLVIALTESQWAVEGTRNVAVIAVKDPLLNTVEQIVSLLESGKVNEAVKLSKQVMKLVKVPMSVSQVELVRMIGDYRERLLTPLVQGEAIANIKRQAKELEKKQKKWHTVGDGKVRESHSFANGQIREQDQPFDLLYGKVMYPGDASLGASLKEIINCRCATEYI